MIRGIHYFSAEVKTKIDVIPRGCFKINIGYQTVFPTKTIFANIVLIYFFTYFGISELEVPGT